MQTEWKEKPLEALEMCELYELARREPMKTFDDWRIVEIRKKCLESMKDWKIYDYLAGWVEEHLLKFRVSELRHHGLLEVMLGWYVLNAQGETTIRAIEFAISLNRVEGSYGSIEDVISKIVVGRLLKNEISNFYPQLVSLPKFLEVLLDELDSPYHIKRNDGRQYFEEDWFCAERALRVIVREKDFSFLPKIEELIVLLQEGKIVPTDKPFYAKTSHLAAFKEARKILLEAKKEGLLGAA